MAWFNPKTGKWSAQIRETPEATKYKERVRWEAMSQKIKPLSGPLRVCYRIHRPRNIGDLDNFTKILKDSLNAIAWIDDSQVNRLEMEIGNKDPERPRVEIYIETWDLYEARRGPKGETDGAGETEAPQKARTRGGIPQESPRPGKKERPGKAKGPQANESEELSGYDSAATDGTL